MPPARKCVVGVLLLLLCSCGHGYRSAATSPRPGNADSVGLVGPTSREAIVRAEASFAPDRAEEVDPEAVTALRTVPPGATITVVLGTWCGDSQREVSRWFRTLDELGPDPPFRVDYIAIGVHEIARGTAPLDVEYVPTFIIERDGAELGRVVETSPNGIERDVLRLLSGEVRGAITSSAL